MTGTAVSDSDRLSRGAYFAASLRSAAFPVNIEGAGLGLLLVDTQTRRIQKLAIRGSHLLSPYLSKDGGRLLFVKHSPGGGGHELIACDTASLACRLILRSLGSISSPVELSEDRILFVQSPKGPRGYNSNDFWIIDRDRLPRKLTDMQLYHISSVSTSKDRLYFSAFGPPWNSNVIPKYDPDLVMQSDLYSLPFDAARGDVENPTAPLTPLYPTHGKSRSPAVSADSSLVAYLRSMNLTVYHYDLIVHDTVANSSQSYSSRGLGFSPPVVVQRSVYANEIYRDRNVIHMFPPDAGQATTLAVITDEDVTSATVNQLNIQ
jgi:hypothetical protein